jgi:hypothetical protein
MADMTSDQRFITYNELLQNFGTSVNDNNTQINSVKTPRVSTKILYCSGDAYIYGDIKTILRAVNGVLLGDGSSGVPSVAFAADPTVGYYRSGNGALTFASNGNDVMTINGTSLAVEQPITAQGNLVLDPTGAIDFSGRPLINVGDISVHVGSPGDVIINDPSGNLTGEAQLATIRGGTGLDTSAANGVARVTAGVWSVSPLTGADFTDVTSISVDELTTSEILSVGDLTISAGNIFLGASTVHRTPTNIAGGDYATYVTNIATTDNTPQTIFTLQTSSGPNGTAYNIQCFISAGDSTGGLNTAAYNFIIKGKNIQGTAAVSNPAQIGIIYDGNLAGTSVAADAAGSNILVEVTGLSSTNIKWVGRFEVLAQQF